MIVQCDQCSSKFRLDDAKVKEGGAKVRCSKCKHIFVVQREASAEEADLDSFLNGLVPPPSEKPGEAGETVTPGAGRPAAEAGKPAETGLFGAEEEAGGFSEKEGFDFGEFAFDAGGDGTPAEPPFGVEEKGGFDFGELDLGGGDSAGREAAPAESGAPSFDAADFSFDEEPAPPVPEMEIKLEGEEFFFEPETEELTAASSTPPVPEMEIRIEDEEFSFEPEIEEPVAAPSARTVPEMEIGLDSGEFSFEQELEEPATAPPVPEPVKGVEQPAPFDFGEFEFGEAAPAEQPLKGEPPPGGPEVWEWDKPEASDRGETAIPPASGQISVPDFAETPMADEELPPLSISSRRKGASILPVAVTAISVLLVLALAGGGYYFFKKGPAAFNTFGLGFMANWFGLETKEEGGVAVRNPVGSFLSNKEAGEIFVINGEAVNNFAKPRASIQVKATLYGAKGEALLQKTVYCGNALSREQLTTQPMAKLEATMANQFGDSLSNLAVQPGKAIPFVVVFTNIPKEAADFGVEVIGSTVASQ